VHLLLVEDDPKLGRSLRRLLGDDRHVVELAPDGETALETVEATGGIELVVLDVGLPDMSGLEVARRIRSRGSQVPILMLTARDGISDRVAGLDAGADDYLVKPFAYEELAARLRALARRASETRRASSRRLINGPIVIDERLRKVTVNGQEIDLSRQEFALLECLVRRPGRVMTRDELLDTAWPFGVAITPNAVETYIHYLRTKLGEAASWIETVRGVGYRMRVP
jgi:DNA-binding response OmpR family regulator